MPARLERFRGARRIFLGKQGRVLELGDLGAASGKLRFAEPMERRIGRLLLAGVGYRVAVFRLGKGGKPSFFGQTR